MTEFNIERYQHRCLIHFSGTDDWNDFRIAELTALLEMINVDPLRVLGPNPRVSSSRDKRVSFMECYLPSFDVAKVLCERAVLVGEVYELWGSAPSLDDLLDPSTNEESISLARMAMVRHETGQGVGEPTAYHCTWSMVVDGHGCSLDWPYREETRERITAFLEVPRACDVNLKSPDVPIVAIMTNSRNDGKKENVDWCYLCRLVCESGMKQHIKRMDLKRREYLGPTSLDASLALLMCNMCKVQPGTIVLDPFVGTASILVGATHFGALSVGADIDIRVLKGDMYAGQKRKGKMAALPVDHKRDIFGNFDTYGLPRPELIRMDNALFDRHIHLKGGSATATGRKADQGCDEGLYDAIVTDPPYSIRAGARKSGKRGGCQYVIERRDDHMAVTQPYRVEEVMLDLLHSAARALKVGGLLAYLIPVPIDFDAGKDLPVHPCLAFVRSCEQALTARHARHCVLLVKTKAYGADEEREFTAYAEGVLREATAAAEATKGERDLDPSQYYTLEPGFSRLMARLERALRAGARDNDAVATRSSKKSAQRWESKKLRTKAKTEKTGYYAESMESSS